MKKVLVLTLCVLMCFTLALAGCTPTQPQQETPAEPANDAPAEPANNDTPAEPANEDPPAEPEPATGGGLELTVVSSYGGDDGNRPNFEESYKEWEQQTGNMVMNNSTVSNEEWKAKVHTDFDTGTEPDVLFFFTGTDADKIVSAGKVVSLDEIRAEYPEYGSNMQEDLLPVSTMDGKKYALPTTGFWEALYCNKVVLDAAGVAVPGADYTWEQFMKDCQTIKDAGYTPVACSLQEVPHYWWEFCAFNHDTIDTHLDIPASSEDPAGQAWAASLEDIKAMYDAGYFPPNTLTEGDQGTFQMMADDQAAFAIDGHWKLGWFLENVGDRLDDYAVAYVPGQNDRKATDIIGGISMGYYITKKAWDDPAKRDAAVSFVQHMTSDAVLAKFSSGGAAPTALLETPQTEGESNPLIESAIKMFQGQTGSAPAVQDMLTGDAKTELFVEPGVKSVVSGNITAAELVDQTIAKNG